jgi:PIN domain nuclease of toxin-antitoxin system
VILLDAYAVLALARNEDVADEIEEIVRTNTVAVTAANYFEATERLVRLWGWSADETSTRMALLLGGPVAVLPVDREIAWRGALLRARYYHRRSSAISLADCMLLASAGHGDSIATADPAVAAVARAEGIGLVPLPDSSGLRP